MEKILEIEGLFKEYKLGIVGRGTLYRDLQSWWAKMRNKEDPNSIIGQEHNVVLSKKNILALNNINLKINKNEILGIIGANGAGKSTLLKILSRITSPTKGLIKIKGKIASLLEVGTGFHSELTGRENIYLNGSINGMQKNKITEKLFKIVEFAGVQQFLDTPVKRYSSGMIVRLGFAVAAYLDPDILIVDEVLAIGDAMFQKKAIKKMKSVSEEEGRTVLFVSHNMDSIRKLCTKVLIMSQGKIIDFGDTENMINKYLNSKNDIRKTYKSISWKIDDHGPGGNIVKLKSLATKNSAGSVCKDFSINEDMVIEVEFWVLKNGYQVCCLFQFSKKGIQIFQTFNDYIEGLWNKQENLSTGLYSSKCFIPKRLFDEGTIDVNVIIFLPPGDVDASAQVQHPIRSAGAISFNMIDDNLSDSARGNFPFAWSRYSQIRPYIKWSTNKISN